MTAVVGLDLSLTGTGIATPEGVRTVDSKGKAGASLRDRGMRLHDLAATICGEIDRVANEYRQVLVVIEGPSLGQSRQGGQHDRAGLWWLVVDELVRPSWCDVVEVSPAARAKYATGKGNAAKDAVLAAVIRRYPDVDVSNNNEADALVLRAMGMDRLGWPLVTVPQLHRTALDKVAWPADAEAMTA